MTLSETIRKARSGLDPRTCRQVMAYLAHKEGRTYAQSLARAQQLVPDLTAGEFEEMAYQADRIAEVEG